MKRCCVIVITALTLGCDPGARPQSVQAGKPAAAPTIDLSTPDRALKSYWAVLDWREVRTREIYAPTQSQRNELKVVADTFARTVTGNIIRPNYDKSDPPNLFIRDIKEVKVESESRAVIFAQIRNATPIPPELTPSADQAKRRDEGDTYRYVLEKVEADWRVSEIWQPEYSGRGWRKYWRSGPATPTVPTGTFGGA